MKNFEKKRGGSQLNFLDEIIVDNFAGGRRGLHRHGAGNRASGGNRHQP